jgi:hypothetical protein
MTGGAAHIDRSNKGAEMAGEHTGISGNSIGAILVISIRTVIYEDAEANWYNSYWCCGNFFYIICGHCCSNFLRHKRMVLAPISEAV